MGYSIGLLSHEVRHLKMTGISGGAMNESSDDDRTGWQLGRGPCVA